MNQGHFVIETYMSEDGKSWWRKYSDGWIEQGGEGQFNAEGTQYNPVTTLVTPFSNTNYVVFAACTPSGWSRGVITHSLTETTFKAGTGSGTGTFRYYACGY